VPRIGKESSRMTQYVCSQNWSTIVLGAYLISVFNDRRWTVTRRWAMRHI
jgi:hypothetical protein